MTNAYEQQKDEELAVIINSFVAEVKAELGERASVNKIEAALLKKQKGLMTKLMQSLVNNQDFSPANPKG